MKKKVQKMKKGKKLLAEADEKIDSKKAEEIEKSLDKAADGEKDGKVKKALKAVGKMLGKILKSYATNKCCDLIDEMLLGQFKDAVIKIYQDENLGKMSDEEAAKALEEMQKDSKFKAGSDNSKLDSRKDDEESTDMDPKTCEFDILWYEPDKEQSIAAILNDLTVKIQEQAKKTQDEQKELVSKIKEMKLDLKDEDVANFGPAIKTMIGNGMKAEDIMKEVKKMKGEVKESCARLKQEYISHRQKILGESRVYLTEAAKQKMFTQALLESETFRDAVVQQLIEEGWGKALLGKAFNKLSNVIPDEAKKKMKDFGAKAVSTLTSKTLAGLVSLGGLGVSVVTGGWAATLALRAIYAVERHGKQLRNAFERTYTKF